MSFPDLIKKSPSSPIISKGFTVKKEMRYQKPLLIALIILGLVGLGIAGIGLAGFGAAPPQSLWAAGALSNLGQINSIIMMATGGIIVLVIGIITAVKKHHANRCNLLKAFLRDDTWTTLKNGEWTFARQQNGEYACLEMNKGIIQVMETDIASKNIEENFESSTFKKTSRLPTDKDNCNLIQSITVFPSTSEPATLEHRCWITLNTGQSANVLLKGYEIAALRRDLPPEKISDNAAFFKDFEDPSITAEDVLETIDWDVITEVKDK